MRETDAAHRIATELRHESAAIWYIADEYGEKVMVKVLSPTIKALIAGCKLEFLYGKDSRHVFPFFHAGLKIWDDPVHYLRMTSIQRFTQEHRSLKRIMDLETVNIHFHNELTICAAAATLTFSSEDRQQVIQFLGNINDLYTGAFNHLAKHSLDCFDHTIDKTQNLTGVQEIALLSIQGKLSDWIIMNNTFIGANETNPIQIDDPDEGGHFEKETWASLEAIFLNALYRSPKIPDKHGFRELTDVLAFHQYGIFLIETKALSIPEIDNERNMDRKVKGLQKQILKGIGQLKGAAKKVAANTNVFDSQGKLIDFDRSICPHCIVLVSELLPFGDWKEIELKMMTTMIEQPMYLHVMDLREFMTYIGFCRGNKERLDASLMDRTSQFVELQTIHIRVDRNTGEFPG